MTPIDCHHCQDHLLEDLLEGRLDDELASLVRAHLETCEACAQEKALLEKDAELIRGALKWTSESRPATPVRQRRVSVAGSHRRAVWLSAAACLLLSLLLYPYLPSEEPEAPVASLPADTPASVDEKPPLVEIETATAKPGETVVLNLRVARVEGLCALEARVRFDPTQVEVTPAKSALGLSSVVGDEVIIASISGDAWKGEDGVAFRIPVKVRGDVPPNTTLDLDLASVRLVGRDKKSLEADRKTGSIRVI